MHRTLTVALFCISLCPQITWGQASGGGASGGSGGLGGGSSGLGGTTPPGVSNIGSGIGGEPPASGSGAARGSVPRSRVHHLAHQKSATSAPIRGRPRNCSGSPRLRHVKRR